MTWQHPIETFKNIRQRYQTAKFGNEDSAELPLVPQDPLPNLRDKTQESPGGSNESSQPDR